MTDIRTMDDEAAVMNGSSDAGETPESGKEEADKTETTTETESGQMRESQSEIAKDTDNKCDDVPEKSVHETETVSDVSSKTSEQTECLTASTEETGIAAADGAASCETVQGETEAVADQHKSTTTEVDTFQTNSISEITEFSSEITSTQTVKQTTLVSSSFQETEVAELTNDLTTDTVKANGNENLLDPEKVSELRGSPYYDSLIANRISMEAEGTFTKTAQAEQKVDENSAATEKQVNGVCPAEEQEAAKEVLPDESEKREATVSKSLGATKDFFSKEVSSLKEACREALSPRGSRTATPSGVMFKVSKFEAKPFAESKKSAEWSFEQSSFFKSGEYELSTTYMAPDAPTSSDEQAQSTEEDMGVPPANEDSPFRFSPNAYKPPPEDEMDYIDLPRKKKMFSSSSFYEEPNAIYPTVEEQVELCRKIADSLSNDSNRKSKGANMFFKRVKRAEKWVVESIGTGYDSDSIEYSRAESVSTPDPSKAPYVRVSQGPPQLKLILDPRHLLDMKRLRQEGVNIVEHNAVSPEICLDLVKDLNSPTGRGAQLFAKRKKKSEEWVVDEEKVKQLLRERESGYTSSPEPPPISAPSGAGIEPLIYPRVQMVKTPWAAAMESPIGSCAGAFRELHPNEIAESVIKAAETKVMTYPAPVRPVIEPVIKPESNVQMQNHPSSAYTPSAIQQQPSRKLASTSSFRTGVYTADPYKPRAPKGWTGTSSGGPQLFAPLSQVFPVTQEPVQVQTRENPIQEQTPSLPSSKLVHHPSLMKSYSFANFNKSPRTWNEASSAYQHMHIKPVKPPSVLVQ